MAQTVDEITLAALRLLNVKAGSTTTLPYTESVDGLQALNDRIEQCNLQPLMQVSKTQLTQALSASDGTYTFGTGGDNSTRPVRINQAWIRNNNVDYPVNIISNDSYSLISFKSITSTIPYNLYYRNEYPLGVVELYPVPSTTGYTLYLEVQAALDTYTAGTDEVTWPPGYNLYFKNQLAIDISPEYKEPSPTIYKNAQEGEAWIKRMNSHDKGSMQRTARQAVSRGSFNYFGGAF